MDKANRKLPRLLSLDVFRGFTIAAMILVNSTGIYNTQNYAFLKHAEWSGCNPADLIFPFFLFIMGVAIPIAFSKRLEAKHSLTKIIFKIIRRSLIIFLLGIFLNGYPYFHITTMRIYGVLQRIALCYLCAAILFLTTSKTTQIIIFFTILLGYWLLMTLAPVPGFGAGNLSPDGNLAGYIDRLVLHGHFHLFGKTYDPEGLLSTLPAIATTLLGIFTGMWLLSKNEPMTKFWGMIIMGIIMAIFGWVWSLWFPIIKDLWTSSFVLWTGGLGLCLYALCYWLLEIKGWRSWSKPFEIFGLNAIAAFFLHVFFYKLQNLIHITQNHQQTNLRAYIVHHLFGWTSLPNASLLYSISYLLFWLLILWILYRHKIYIKI